MIIIVIVAFWPVVRKISQDTPEQAISVLHLLRSKHGTLADAERVLGKPDVIHPVDGPYTQYLWRFFRRGFNHEEVATVYAEAFARGELIEIGRGYADPFLDENNRERYWKKFEGTEAWKLRWLRLLHNLGFSSEYEGFVSNTTFSF